MKLFETLIEKFITLYLAYQQGKAIQKIEGVKNVQKAKKEANELWNNLVNDSKFSSMWNKRNK